MKKPQFAITIGDPAGIGPEIILKALAHFSQSDQIQWTLHADSWMVETWAENLGLPLPRIRYHSLGIARTAFTDPQACADIAWRSLKSASAALSSGENAGVVTAPISKERLQRIGFPYPGHTEFFAAGSGNVPVRMMFVGRTLKIVLETIHVPLASVPSALSQAHFEETLMLARTTLQTQFGIAAPRLAVCGLNPHAGENGYLGQEEITLLKPVIARFNEVDGPFAADAYFGARTFEKYDATICMYHDQGLIPFKLFDFDSGVNMTIGLPYVRTSPDHGCAFDIAGKGIANPNSFIAAMKLAISVTRDPSTRCARSG